MDDVGEVLRPPRRPLHPEQVHEVRHRNLEGASGPDDAPRDDTIGIDKSLRLRTTTLFDATTCPGNTLVRLYDPNGNALGFDDDDGVAGGCSLIDPAVDAFAANLAAGTYYIRVEEQGNDATIGPYQLLVEVL